MRAAVCAIAVAALASAGPATSANYVGALDPTFGTGGRVVTDFGGHDRPWSLALQADGRIVVAGESDAAGTPYASDFALARYNRDGTVDSSFGTEGKVLTDIGDGQPDWASAVAAQPDGKVVAVGCATTSSQGPRGFALARYAQDGRLDVDFGTGGVVETRLEFGCATSVAVQPDGKIVVAGYSRRQPGRYPFTFARYTVGGLLDTTFSTGGLAFVDVRDHSTAWALALQPDGKVVAAGSSSRQTGGWDLALVRLTADGRLDTTFGAGGTTLTTFGDYYAEAQAVALQPNGMIVVAGRRVTASDESDFALARYTGDGRLDPGFGSDGRFVYDGNWRSEGAHAVAIAADGKIVVGGTSMWGATILRLDADGRLDATFGSGGVSTYLSLGPIDGMALEPDGDIVAAGGQSDNFAAVRVLSPTPTPPQPGQGGTLKFNMSATDVDFTDPSLAYGTISWQLEYATALKLFNYPDAPAPEGSMIVAEAAAGFPLISADGKTYTITVRPGLRFSDGRPVTAENFAFAINRGLSPVMRSPAVPFIQNIVGAQAVIDGRAQTASGVRVDGDKLIIELTQPDGGLLAKLAMPFFQAVPLDLPLDQQGVAAYASAGPYYFAGREVGRQITIKRNPYYTGSRPAFADEFDITVNTNLDQSLLQVKSGEVDYDLGGLPATAHADLGLTYGVNAPNGRYHVNPLVETDYIALNTSRLPFSNVNLRKAFNYALDRPAMIALRGAYAATPTDQILPPDMGGFRDVHLYPIDGPDLVTARALAGDSCGTVKLWTGTSAVGQNLGQVAKHGLEQIGCTVEVKLFQGFQIYTAAGQRGADFDAVLVGWNQDYPDPYDFLDLLLNGGKIHESNNNNLAYFDDHVVNAKLDAANLLVGADRYQAYGDLDVEIMRDHAPWVPYDNRNQREFTAARLAGYLFQPANASADLNTLRLRALNDTTPPTLILPAAISVEATGPDGATVTYTVSASDDVDASPTISCSPPSGSVFAIGVTTVACTGTDAAGNLATGSFTVEVGDRTPPTLKLPPAISAEATGAAGTTVTYTVTASDVVDPNPVVNCKPVSGSVFAIGLTSVSCTAIDAAGNRASGSFTVEVRDTTPPALTMPESILVKATGLAGAAVAYAVTASDAVDPSPAVRCTPASGTVFAIGATSVACTATDAAANVASASFSVEVIGGAKAHHVAIEFVTELGGLATRWEGDVVTGTVMAMPDGGVLDWVGADARYADPAVTLKLDLRSRHVARLMTGSLTATRGNARIQIRDVIAPFALGADGSVETVVPVHATYYDGVHLVFGSVSFRLTGTD